MNKNICIIPARMGSSRLPGKPLIKILGKELIQHVYENCIKSKLFDTTIIATPDKEISNFCSTIGAHSIMTSKEHQRASDRCNEAVIKLEKDGYIYDICTMVQGDEPLVKANVIDKITNTLIKNKSIFCANGLGDLKLEELENENCIKVVKDLDSNAIFFSRKSIPWNASINENVGKQICVIPFKTSFLKTYSQLNETPLEICESIDMLRVIEHGYKVKLVKVKGFFHPVDVLEDVDIVEKIMKEQGLN